MNILICSVGRRVKLIEYFKEEVKKRDGRVIAVDCDPTAAALKFADEYEIVPRIDHPEYISVLKSLCQKYEIKAVLSLIDPELSLLASVKDEFEEEGVSVIVSGQSVVEICFDKYQTYKFLQANDLPHVPTYIDVEKVMRELRKKQIHFPLIIKPKNGSASIGINKITNMKQLETYRETTEELVIQPFISGEEFGVDCYVDLISKEITNLFIKRKIRMRGGETDKSVAVKNPEIKQMVEKLLGSLKLIGPIDIDCFKSENGTYVISEINPRFGGGYVHAYECRQNFVRNIVNNVSGEANPINKSTYLEGSILIKYDQHIVI